MQIVQLGVVEGADELQYAPIKAFAKGADRKFFENLAKFRIRKIPDSDEEKVESYDCIINLFWQKRYRSIQETLVYLREVLKMSEKDIAKMFLPNAWMEEKKSNWVDFMKVMLKEHRLNLDEAADSPSRPEFLTRNEAIELLTQKAS